MLGSNRQYSSAAFKLKVLEYAKTHSNYQTGKYFDVDESSVRRWKSLKKLLESCPLEKRAFTGPKHGQYPQLESELEVFVKNCLSTGALIKILDLRSKAIEIAKRLRISSETFKASRHWCLNFLRRSKLSKKLFLQPGMRKNKKSKPYATDGSYDSKKKVEVENRRSPLAKRTIKKPKMDQFVTFSDCSDLEEEVGPELTDFEISDDDSSYHDEEEEVEEADSLDGQPGDETLKGVPWAKLRIPDEVAIQEVNPGLEVYMETLDGKRIKTEPCEQNPHVESTSEFDADNGIIESITCTPDRENPVGSPLTDPQNASIRKDKSRVTFEQREKMLKFMMEHPEVAGGRLSGPEGMKMKQQLCDKMKNVLNNCPTGATKSAEKWYKSWQDWKSDIKAKATKLKQASESNKGQYLRVVPLSPVEENLLTFITSAANSVMKAIGDSVVEEMVEKRIEREQTVEEVKEMEGEKEVEKPEGTTAGDKATAYCTAVSVPVDCPRPQPQKQRQISVYMKDSSDVEERIVKSTEAKAEAMNRIAEAMEGIATSIQSGESNRRFALDGEGRLILSLEKKKQSPVWRHFMRHPSLPEVAICNYCSAGLKTCKGSTSTLARHVLTHLRKRKTLGVNVDALMRPLSSPMPPIQVSSVQSLRSSPILPPPRQTKDKAVSVSLNVSPERLPMNVERFRLITEKVAQMMVRDYQPPSIVQNSGFRDLISELEPKYQLPSVSYFADVVIPELCNKMLEKRKEEYSAVVRGAKWCSLTVDRWTSGVGGSIHLGITCHNMSEDFTVSRQFLTNSLLGGKQSGQDMHRTIISALEEWGFNTAEMQLYVVTESARELQAAASSSKCPWTVVQCFGHNLQLVVHGAMDSTSGYTEMSRKARDISHRYNTVLAARRDLKTAQRKQRTKNSSGDDELVCQEWGTIGDNAMGHWVVEYSMIERLVKHKEAIKAELEGSGVGSKLGLDLEKGEWDLAESVVDVLKPIYEAIKDFCLSSYPPLSMTIPIVYGIEHMLGKVLQEASGASGTPSGSKPSTPTPSSPSTVFAKNLLKAVRSRFPSYKTNKTSLVAMVLDPRYKAVILTEQEVNLVTKILVDEINDISSQSPSSSSSPTKDTSNQTRKEGRSQKKRPSKKSSLSSLLWSAFEEVSRDQPAGSGKKLALYQVKQYLDEPVLSRTCDPFLWWLENREKYDLMLPVARKYASIPATQVQGSHLIGHSADADVAARRLFLSETSVGQLVFLHENS